MLINSHIRLFPHACVSYNTGIIRLNCFFFFIYSALVFVVFFFVLLCPYLASRQQASKHGTVQGVGVFIELCFFRRCARDY